MDTHAYIREAANALDVAYEAYNDEVYRVAAQYVIEDLRSHLRLVDSSGVVLGVDMTTPRGARMLVAAVKRQQRGVEK